MIPKIIWQTHKFDAGSIPDPFIKCNSTWIDKNLGWEYRYIKNSELEYFVKDNFGKEWCELFISCPLEIMRVDIWKYMCLYKEGGVYADMDTICKTPIESWIDNNKIVVFPNDDKKNLSQWVIASEPGHPIIKNILDNIKNILPKKEYYRDDFVAEYTGFLQFTNSILKILNIDNSIELVYNDINTSNNEYGIFCYHEDGWNAMNNVIFKNINGSLNFKDINPSWVIDQEKVIRENSNE